MTTARRLGEQAGLALRSDLDDTRPRIVDAATELAREIPWLGADTRDEIAAVASRIDAAQDGLEYLDFALQLVERLETMRLWSASFDPVRWAERLAGRFDEVDEIRLVGSRAVGAVHADSDFDLVIALRPWSLEAEATIARDPAVRKDALDLFFIRPSGDVGHWNPDLDPTEAMIDPTAAAASPETFLRWLSRRSDREAPWSVPGFASHLGTVAYYRVSPVLFARTASR